MRRLAFVVSGLLLVGLTWAWVQGAKVSPTDEISSTDYDPGVTAVGTKLYADLAALQTAVDNIDSSNVSESANIQGSKLLANSIDYLKLDYRDFDVAAVSWAFETDAFDDTTFDRLMGVASIDSAVSDTVFANRSVPLRKIQGSVPYIVDDPGHKKIAWGRVTKADTAFDYQDSCSVLITFADSTDVGDPAFAAIPRIFYQVSWVATRKRQPVCLIPYGESTTSACLWVVNMAFATEDSISGPFEIHWFAVEQ